MLSADNDKNWLSTILFEAQVEGCLVTLLELLTLEGALVCDADGILDFDTSVALLTLVLHFCTLDEGIFASDGDKSLSVTFLAAAAVSPEPLSSSLTASWSENVADIASNCPLTSLGETKPGEA